MTRDDELLAWKPLVCKLAIRYGRGLHPGNVEDSEEYSDGWIGLIKASDTFDPSKATFITWATWCVRGYIMAGIRRRRILHDRLGEPRPICDNRSAVDPRFEAIDAGSEIRRLLPMLSQAEYDLVYRRVVLGWTLSELAKAHRPPVTKEAIRSRINRILRMLREAHR